MSGETTFWDAVDALREREVGYAREAYGFVAGALSATVQSLPPERLADGDRRHLSGGELVLGVIRMAREEFGVLAPMVFREWGVTSGEDIGRIVFQLVAANQLSAREQDTMADFVAGPDLLESLSHVPDFGRRGQGGTSAQTA